VALRWASERGEAARGVVILIARELHTAVSPPHAPPYTRLCRDPSQAGADEGLSAQLATGNCLLSDREAKLFTFAKPQVGTTNACYPAS
jgi:hypothetical protein